MTILRFWWSNFNLTKEFKMMLYYRKTDFTATAWAHISQTLQIIVQLVCKTAVKASCFFLSLCLYSDWVAYSAEMEDKKDLFVRCSVYPVMTSLTEMRLKRIFEIFFFLIFWELKRVKKWLQCYDWARVSQKKVKNQRDNSDAECVPLQWTLWLIDEKFELWKQVSSELFSVNTDPISFNL